MSLLKQQLLRPHIWWNLAMAYVQTWKQGRFLQRYEFPRVATKTVSFVSFLFIFSPKSLSLNSFIELYPLHRVTWLLFFYFLLYFQFSAQTAYQVSPSAGYEQPGNRFRLHISSMSRDVDLWVTGNMFLLGSKNRPFRLRWGWFSPLAESRQRDMFEFF